MCYIDLMASEPLHRISVEEYLAVERRSETKSEYLNGEIFSMAGASRSHNRIVLNLGISLDGQLKNRGCEIFVNDMRVSVPAADLITYPDVVVSCGNPQFADEGADTLLNPTLIIEVLSSSTESYDRGGKFAYYRTLPSLAEYLLLAQDRVYAEHFVKQPNGGWLLTEANGFADVLDLPSVGCTLAMREVYDRVLLPDSQ
ncbi:MAG TPA: Uma2 family endonuclease [Thermoanaerobaculia bacterium]|jgi:Uma2 family endonuclease|nr:Uma2 family endonuclease [Thermoanaerobaculia bacterium]